MIAQPFLPSNMKAFLYATALSLLLTPATVAGQSVPTDPRDAADASVIAATVPAHIAVVDGGATVERDGLVQPAASNAPFVPGDRLRTSRGRVELLFPDGSALDVDEESTVDLQGPALIRLSSGRLILTVTGANDPAAATPYQIDTPAATAQTDGPGEYRIAVLDDRGTETELIVRRGFASLTTDQSAMSLGAGERGVARDGVGVSAARFNSARADAFDLWAATERDARLTATSQQYLPPDLRMYGGTFDQYGSWEYTEPYGYAWYPSASADWRPYYNGYWAAYQPWGWTWVGFDRWSWPTHHYGRWGYVGGRWCWVPGRTWGPAWVAWADAPGYVGWCPLGFDGRPVFGFSSRFADRWSGWTIVPRHSFGTVARVDHTAIAPRSIPVTTAFVTHRAAPVPAPRMAHQGLGSHQPVGIAVPRQPTLGRQQSIVQSQQSTVQSQQSPVQSQQSPVQSRQSTAAARPGLAVPRQPHREMQPVAPPSITQPLPDAVRSPGYAVPRQPSSPNPAATSGAIVPRAPAPVAHPAPVYQPPVYQAPVAVPRPAPAAPPVHAAPVPQPAAAQPAPAATPAAPPRGSAPAQAVPRAGASESRPAPSGSAAAPAAAPRTAPASSPAAGVPPPRSPHRQ